MTTLLCVVMAPSSGQPALPLTYPPSRWLAARIFCRAPSGDDRYAVDENKYDIHVPDRTAVQEAIWRRHRVPHGRAQAPPTVKFTFFVSF